MSNINIHSYDNELIQNIKHGFPNGRHHYNCVMGTGLWPTSRTGSQKTEPQQNCHDYVIRTNIKDGFPNGWATQNCNCHGFRANISMSSISWLLTISSIVSQIPKPTQNYHGYEFRGMIWLGSKITEPPQNCYRSYKKWLPECQSHHKTARAMGVNINGVSSNCRTP